jgi:hypothetical protein
MGQMCLDATLAVRQDVLMVVSTRTEVASGNYCLTFRESLVLTGEST